MDRSKRSAALRAKSKISVPVPVTELWEEEPGVPFLLPHRITTTILCPLTPKTNIRTSRMGTKTRSTSPRPVSVLFPSGDVEFHWCILLSEIGRPCCCSKQLATPHCFTNQLHSDGRSRLSFKQEKSRGKMKG